MCGTQRRRDRVEFVGPLVEVKTIRKVVGWRVGITQRSQCKSLLDKFQDASEIMPHVRNVASLGIGRDHDQRYAKPINISATPLYAICKHLRGRNVIIQTAPVIPCNQYRCICPVATVSDS